MIRTLPTRARLAGVLDHRAIRPGLLIAGAVFAVSQGLAAARGEPLTLYDAHAYWTAAALDHPYASTIAGGFDAAGGLYEFKYPPIVAQIAFPIHLLPWPIFATIWAFTLVVLVVAIAGRWAPFALLFPPVLGELWLGNVNLVIALATVIGLTRPWAWAFVFLTKTVPAVGLLWYPFRGDWRRVVPVVAGSATLMAASFVIAPGLWADWVRALGTQAPALTAVPRQAIPIGLPERLPLAIALVWVAAQQERAWIVPIAVCLAMPFLWWNTLSICIAVLPLLDSRGRPALATGRAVREGSASTFA